MDVSLYLDRIRYRGTTDPSLETLLGLHKCHVLSVPFESLSIHCGEKITLDPPSVYDKIVQRHRGGFCFENNSLFFWLLKEMGYQVQMVSGHVQNIFTKRYGPPNDHMVLLVDLGNQRWICDVGFGDAFRTPLLLEADKEQVQDNGVFKLQQDGEKWYLQRLLEDEGTGTQEWTSLYKFTQKEQKLEDFRGMCEYHQTSPSSIFFSKSFCSLHVPEGKVTYMGWRLIITTFTGTSSQKTTIQLPEEEIPNVLRERFGIVLTSQLIPKDDAIIPPPPIY
ncbi:arylamine N-acetyltransferase 2 isoform X2 [Microcaecilia unicolor]|nr:arylamine N-acetyltransferase 2-like isoform X2 [Microcaecilia unicolor]XP_030064968.1 arylamine N-acetyltransferase 2-like isoform X2 [Microcaecilia unicolor]XP_030064969.1 arylamine N-acetyltransferase 2-like isoform X2 [Microcaecilia unicolor]